MSSTTSQASSRNRTNTLLRFFGFLYFGFFLRAGGGAEGFGRPGCVRPELRSGSILRLRSGAPQAAQLSSWRVSPARTSAARVPQ